MNIKHNLSVRLNNMYQRNVEIFFVDDEMLKVINIKKS